MPFSRPTLPELIARVETDLLSRLQIVSTVLRRAMVRIVARVFAGAVHALHGHLEWASRQILVSTADAEFMDLHGAELGLSRKVATFAAGPVTFTGTNGTSVPVGTRLLRQDGVEYQTTATGVIASGTLTLAVVALVAGATGNTEAAVVLSMITSIAGVNNVTTVAAGGIINGVDAEADDDYRARILARKRNPPQGGSEADFLNWTLEVAGVTRAWVYPNYLGVGNVGVTFVVDGLPNIIPVGGKVTEVQSYLDDPTRRPICATVNVFAPTGVAFAPTIALTPNTAEVRAAVIAELTDYLFREAAPGATLLLSQINEAISAAAGEINHTLTLPVADVTHTSTQIATLGTVTFT